MNRPVVDNNYVSRIIPFKYYYIPAIIFRRRRCDSCTLIIPREDLALPILLPVFWQLGAQVTDRVEAKK